MLSSSDDESVEVLAAAVVTTTAQTAAAAAAARNSRLQTMSSSIMQESDDDDDLRRALEQSMASYQVEKERRRRSSSPSAGADNKRPYSRVAAAAVTKCPPAVAAADDSDDALDVLPPSSTVTMEQSAARLSFSGGARSPLSISSSPDKDAREVPADAEAYSSNAPNIELPSSPDSSSVDVQASLTERCRAKQKQPQTRTSKVVSQSALLLERQPTQAAASVIRHTGQDWRTVNADKILSKLQFMDDSSDNDESGNLFVKTASAVAAASIGRAARAATDAQSTTTMPSRRKKRTTASSQGLTARAKLDSSDDEPPPRPAVSTLNIALQEEPPPGSVPKQLVTRSVLDSSSNESDDDDALPPSRPIWPSSNAALNKKPPPPARSALDSSDDESAESAAVAAGAQPQFCRTTDKQRQRQATQEAARARKEAQKRADQARKAAAKERAQQQRAQDQATERASKKRLVEQAQQAAGKFCRHEVAVLLERELFRHATLPIVASLQELEMQAYEFPSAFDCQAIQFVRKDHLQGGAEHAFRQLQAGHRDGYEHLSLMCIVFDVPHDFINLLQRTEEDDSRDDDDDDYPKLQSWVRGLQVGWKHAWRVQDHRQPRVIMLLYQVKQTLDKLWVNYRKHRRKNETPPPSSEELHDALTWMMIQFQIECIHVGTPSDLTYEICKMARLLSEEPYQGQVTELECVKKLKCRVKEDDPPLERARDCWFRQVQQIPRVSLPMARNLTQYFPTGRALWLAYQNDTLSEDEKRMLVAEMLSPHQRQAKVSNWVYTVMTSTDPNELLR